MDHAEQDIESVTRPPSPIKYGRNSAIFSSHSSASELYHPVKPRQ